ncbi:hypothetical protein JOM56_007125 [Amanita muscaria]
MFTPSKLVVTVITATVGLSLHKIYAHCPQIIPRSTFFSIGIKRRPPRSYPPDEVDEKPKRLNGTQYFCLNHGIPDKTEACHVSIPNDASGFLFSVAATVDSAPKTGHFFGGDSVISD